MTQELSVKTSTVQSLLMSPERMQNLIAFADLMANGRVMVPKHLHGQPADCLAVAMQATEWGMNPFTVAQKTHLVSGTLGYEAQLIIAVLQTSGAIVGRPHYEYQGEGANLQCRFGAIPAGEKEVVFNEWLAFSTVTTKNSPLWKSNPKQQMGYLQAKNWARLYAPGAILGVYSPDELEERFIPEDQSPALPITATAEPEPLPPCAPERFAELLPNWQKLIAEGTKTADAIIENLGKKYTLTDDQKSAIKGEPTESAE